MTMTKTASQPLPNWLTTSDERAMPFRRDTQQHLLKRAEEDPRVITIIARIEAKTEKYIAEHPKSNPYNRSTLLTACPEWQWVKRICRDSSKVLNELHADPIMTIAEQADIISLAAYREDYSFTHFFIEYANKASLAGDESQKPRMTQEERRAYAESIRMLYPIACDLQPQVALAYAPHVMHALQPYGLGEEVVANYTKLARSHPSMVLARPQQFDSFPHRDKILNAAKKARAQRAKEAVTLSGSEAVAEANLVAIEELTAAKATWGNRTKISQDATPTRAK